MSRRTGFDLAVVGAGSAGFSAAITAAEKDARVALVNLGTIGGTCVNVGCVPSKALIRAAEALHGAATAGRFAGIQGGSVLEDWAALRRQKDALVADLRQAKYADLLEAYPGITLVEGRARLIEDGVEAGDQTIATERIVVTTGSRPAVPAIEGLDEVDWLDSTGAMAFEALPASMIVLGGGYVGVELAQMFARLGVAVTLVCRRSVLPEAEPEIGRALARCLAAEGIEVVTGARCRGVRPTTGGVRLDGAVEGGPIGLEAERLLVAIGRRPNSGALGLEDLGVDLDARGGIPVDRAMRSNRPGVYAAGDVTGTDMFVYMAAHGGRIAALNALDSDCHAYDESAIPKVVFSDPQVASVGLGEAEARARGHEVKTSILPLGQVPRALVSRRTEGLVKLVADRADDRLLGAHILSVEAGDSIQTAALAIRCGMTTKALAEAIFPYLTTVEGLKLAAQAFERDVSRLSCCAG